MSDRAAIRHEQNLAAMTGNFGLTEADAELRAEIRAALHPREDVLIENRRWNAPPPKPTGRGGGLPAASPPHWARVLTVALWVAAAVLVVAAVTR